MSERFSPKALQFIDDVLRLAPKLAVFDCDGTLWSGDAGEGFFDWELKRAIVSDEIVRWARPRYAEYKAGKVPEDVMCGEMVTMHRGLKESEVQEVAREYFDTTFVPNIFDAKPADYRAATVTVLHGGADASAVLLPIVR